MGVTGLWKLVEQCGKPVPVDVLENKTLAVDISIWLHQVIKGFHDNKGGALSYAHVLGLFYRVLKLLNYRVRPIFVFDGGVPQLKLDTIARRSTERSKLTKESDRLQALILQSLAQEKIVQQALGPNATELLLKSPTKRLINNKRGNKGEDEMFKLPELPEPPKLQAITGTEEDCNDSKDDDDYSDSFDQSTTSLDDSSFDECNPRYAYNINLQKIDVTSEDFRNLPANIRHEILVDLKETRKQSSWGRLHELPKESNDFSNFQMNRLLKRRAIQVSLEDAEQEMGGRSLTYSEFQSLFAEEGLIDPSTIEKKTRPIISDEHTRFLLVRDLQKKVKNETQQSMKEEEKDAADKIADNNVKKVEPKEIKSEDDVNSLEQAAKIQSAIQLLKEIAAQGTSSAGKTVVTQPIEKEVENLLTKEEKHKNVSTVLLSSDDSDSDDEFEVVDEISAQKPIEILVDKNIKPEDDLFADIFEDFQQFTNENKNKNDIVEIISSDDEDVEGVEDAVEASTHPIDVTIEKSNLEDQHKAINVEQQMVEPVEATIETENKSSSPNLTKQVHQPMEEQPPVEEVVKTKDVTLNLSSVQKTSKAVEILKGLQKDLDDLKKGAESTGLAELTANILPVVTETIEIIDDEDKLPTKPACKSPISSPFKSENPITPSKNKTINDFFETEYLIKRTPEKLSKDEEPTPKVKSPFFVKKTPKSDRKNVTSPSKAATGSKVAKSLFDISDDNEVGNDDGVKKLTPPKTEDIINEAAVILREQKTEDELRSMANDLAKQQCILEAERNRQERMGLSVSQRMISDCQNLLRLFGIPYIVAPMEAEAQCAFFDAHGITHGTITDDSDIWLFGGRTVYKNFFDQDKNVLEFRVNKIEQAFNVDRQKLIQFAYLVGSDYTTGINGIGAVTALEILAQFNNLRETSTSSVDASALAALKRFRDWWLLNKNTTSPPGSSMRLALWKKLKNIELQEGFPNPAVIHSYLQPVIDESEAPFQWGVPDVESIREFAKKTFGWTRTKTDGLLMPVLKRMNEKTSQSSIKNYFNVASPITKRPLQVSKRVRQAIEKLSDKNEEPADGQDTASSTAPQKPKRTRKAKVDNNGSAANKNKNANSKPKRATKRKPKAKATAADDEATSEVAVDKDVLLDALPSADLTESVEPPRRGPQTSKPAPLPESTIAPPARKAPRLSKLREVIPQREMEAAQMHANMERAIEVLKKTKEMAKSK